MKKNGFVLVETIVVIAFLASALLGIYSMFNGVLTNEKRKSLYDDPTYLYRTYYIMDLLIDNDIVNYLEKNLDENKSTSDTLLIEVGCTNTFLFKPGSTTYNICQNLIATGYLEVEHIYFTHSNTKPLTNCTNQNGDICQTHPSLRGLTINAKNYLKSLKTPMNDQDGYYIIIEYLREVGLKKSYYYASLPIPRGEAVSYEK